MAVPKISILAAELIARIEQTPEFAGKGYSIYNLDDLVEQTAIQAMPAVGVSYGGMEPKENSVGAVAQGSYSVSFNTVRFDVIFAVEYRAVGKEDAKVTALDLLDQVRTTLIGYKAANARPWRLAGESPIGDDEGVIFYAQTWETDIPLAGTFQQQ